MLDVRQLLRAQARKLGVRLDIIEKDYAISYLVAAIAETPALIPIVLKGGTALRKAYYADYRFSEDLDYSTLDGRPLPDLPEAINAAVRRMAERLNERGPFMVTHEPLLLREPHPGGQAAYLVRVRFPGQRQALCRLKVEITVDEPVLLPVESRPLRHGFDEELPAMLRVYALAEIVAEKLRALLQSARHLRERGWGASRVCRDYYDLWSVLRHGDWQGYSIPDLVRRKSDLRRVTFSSPQDFLAEELLNVARREWRAQLLPFLSQPVPVEQVLSDLQILLPALWKEAGLTG
jgi:predicted nucleotidyltransferase component of viral defense system